MKKKMKYEIAIVEVLHYLKGIAKEDIEKIPPKFINYLKSHADPNYVCQFDYTKPLNELKLHPETKGLLALICLNYWCTTEEEKKLFLARLSENEQKHLEQLYKNNNIFNKD